MHSSKTPSGAARHGLLSLCLLAWLTLSGCQSAPKLQPVSPPSEYLQDCVKPKPTGRTNAALAEYALGLSDALDRCNADKAALRDWSASIK
jgi:hypothetical protein